MRKCVECGGKNLTHTSEMVSFSDVAMVEAEIDVCLKCGARYVGYQRMEDLVKRVAHEIAHKPERLSPEERRFLRTYLGYSSKDFADFLSVSPETVSRWESKTSPMDMERRTELLIRFMALSEKPVADYGLEEAGRKDPSSRKPTFKRTSGEWRAT